MEELLSTLFDQWLWLVGGVAMTLAGFYEWSKHARTSPALFFGGAAISVAVAFVLSFNVIQAKRDAAVERAVAAEAMLAAERNTPTKQRLRDAEEDADAARRESEQTRRESEQTRRDFDDYKRSNQQRSIDEATFSKLHAALAALVTDSTNPPPRSTSFRCLRTQRAGFTHPE